MKKTVVPLAQKYSTWHWAQERNVALAGRELLDPRDESGARDSELHRAGVVAVDARDRVRLPARELLERLVGVPVAEVADRDEARLDLLGLGGLRSGLPTEFSVERHDRGVAVEAVSRLLRLRGNVTLRVLLVREHERVAAPVAIVHREEVPGENAREPRISHGLLGRESLGAAAAAVFCVRQFGGALVAVVLARPVRAPLRRIDVVLRDGDELDVAVLCLLLLLGDVHEESGPAERP